MTEPISCSWSPTRRSTRTPDWLGSASFHGVPSVVATRSAPSYSDIEYWFRTWPGTEPAPTWAAGPSPCRSNAWRAVENAAGSRAPCWSGATYWLAARYSVDADAYTVLVSATTVVVSAGSKPSWKSTRSTDVSPMPALTSGTNTSWQLTSSPSTVSAPDVFGAVVVRNDGSQSSMAVAAMSASSVLAPSTPPMATPISGWGWGYVATTTRATPSTTRVDTWLPSTSVVWTICGAARSATSMSWITVPATKGGSVGMGPGSGSGTGSGRGSGGGGATSVPLPIAPTPAVGAGPTTSTAIG